MKIKIFLVMLCMIFLFNPISAQYDLGFVEKGECVDLYQLCLNCSYVNVTSIKYPNNTIIYHNFEMDENGKDYTYSFCETNFEGDYFYTTCGDMDGIEDCRTFDFYVNEGGVEMTESRSSLTIGLLIILLLLFFGSLCGTFKIENYIAKFSLYWVSHLLLLVICFIAWQVGVEGLLGGVALTGIFRIFFWILTIAILPMMILSGSWIMYIHTFNEHFQKLTDKGMDTESAFRMSKRKSGGWLNGK